MKKYDSYKKTGIFWESEVPKHWDILKFKRVFDERSEKGYPNEPLLVASQNMGVVPKNIYGKRTVEAQKDLHLLKLVKVGDYVISLRSFQGGLEYAYYQGIISPAYTILKTTKLSESNYFKYLFKSKVFIELLKQCVTGIREGQNVDYPKMKNSYFALPPRSEQDQIVRFLDWKVSEINRLISIQKKKIVELEELKKATINHAVTKGLNPNVEMKDSGVYWLGEIPIDWNIKKLRQILKSVSKKNQPQLQLLSVVREKGVIVRDVDDKESNHNFIPDDLSNYKVVDTGQFVINKMKAWQGSYGVSAFKGIVSPAYFIFDINFDNLEYFHYAIRSKVYVNFFAQSSDGIRVGQWDLQMDKMKEIPLFIPPIEEQEKIVAYIKENTQKYDIAIERLSNEINNLQELKTTLISDVVTGKIDIRDVVIPEYERFEEQYSSDEETSDDASEETEE